MPELEGHAKRRSLQALLALEKPQLSLERAGGEPSRVKGAREEAIAIEKCFTTINLEEKKDQAPSDAASKILSRVASQRRGPPLELAPAPRATEAGAASIASDALHGATATLSHLEIGAEGLGARQGRSSLSGRPGALAARSSTRQLPLLVAEVKKPVAGGHLRDKQKALGQACDCAESPRARGRGGASRLLERRGRGRGRQEQGVAAQALLALRQPASQRRRSRKQARLRLWRRRQRCGRLTPAPRGPLRVTSSTARLSRRRVENLAGPRLSRLVSWLTRSAPRSAALFAQRPRRTSPSAIYSRSLHIFSPTRSASPLKGAAAPGAL